MNKANRFIPTRLISQDYLQGLQHELKSISQRKALESTANVNKLLELRNEYTKLLAEGGTTEEKINQLNRLMHGLIEATLEYQSQQPTVKSTPKTADATTATYTPKTTTTATATSDETTIGTYICTVGTFTVQIFQLLLRRSATQLRVEHREHLRSDWVCTYHKDKVFSRIFRFAVAEPNLAKHLSYQYPVKVRSIYDQRYRQQCNQQYVYVQFIFQNPRNSLSENSAENSAASQKTVIEAATSSTARTRSPGSSIPARIFTNKKFKTLPDLETDPGRVLRTGKRPEYFPRRKQKQKPWQ